MHVGDIASTTTHGTYTADVSLVSEYVNMYYSHGFSINGRDALAMLTASVTAVNDWFRGENELDMLIALGECGVPVSAIRQHMIAASNDDNYADEIHAFKVNVLGMHCADYRCMLHHADAIYTEAYEMNAEYDELVKAAASMNRRVDFLRKRITDNYAELDKTARRIEEIHGR